MADIKILWGSEFNRGDVGVSGADLETDEGLETAIIVSLFTDRRVRDDEELPAGEASRRGWWGDVDAAKGDQTGSRLWLLTREKQMPQVVAKANEYAKEAVQWLIDDKIATRVDVLAEAVKFGELDIQITVHRPRGNAIKFRYNYEWNAQAGATTA